MQQLTVRQMEVIRAVSLHGSVTEAAAALGISQPAVSLMLRECAAHAGFPFFVRKRGRLQSTRETQELLTELNRIFDSIERVNRLVGDMRETTAGTVHIATLPTLAENLVAPTSVEFRKAWPQIQISVTTSSDNLSAAEAVAQERADLGILLSPTRHEAERLRGARVIDLCTVDMVCLVHPDSPLAGRQVVTPADLEPYPLISFDRSLPLGELLEGSYRKAGVARRTAIGITFTSVAYSLTRSGAGVAIIDPFYVRTRHDPDVVVLRFEPRTRVKAQLLLPSNTALPRAAQLFVAALRKTASAVHPGT